MEMKYKIYKTYNDLEQLFLHFEVTRTYEVGEIVYVEYNVNNHQLMHQIICDHVGKYDFSNYNHQKILANILCVIDVETPEALELVLHIIAKFMVVVEWDGLGRISFDQKPGNLNEPEHTHIRNGILDAIMRISSASQFVILGLKKYLQCNDRSLSAAAFFLLSVWFGAGHSEKIDFDRFSTVITELSKSEDVFIKVRTTVILQGIESAKKRQLMSLSKSFEASPNC